MLTDREIVPTTDGLKKTEQERLKTVHRKQIADRTRDSMQSGDPLRNAENEEAQIEHALVERVWMFDLDLD